MLSALGLFLAVNNWTIVGGSVLIVGATVLIVSWLLRATRVVETSPHIGDASGPVGVGLDSDIRAIVHGTHLWSAKRAIDALGVLELKEFANALAAILSLKGALPAHRITLLVAEEGVTTLLCAARTGDSPETSFRSNWRIPSNEGIVRDAIADGVSYRSIDFDPSRQLALYVTYLEEELNYPRSRAEGLKIKAQSLLGAPLYDNGDFVGAVTVEFEPGGIFDDLCDDQKKRALGPHIDRLARFAATLSRSGALVGFANTFPI